MQFDHSLSWDDLKAILPSAKIISEGVVITGINEIHKVQRGDITFVDNSKYYKRALNSAASVIIIDQAVECPEGKALIVSDDPFRDYNKIVNHFRKFEPTNKAINSDQIGDGTIIQPGVFIGHHVKIGKNCLIHANVVIYDHAEIGDNVIIHANAVIGGEAFYYKRRPQGYDKLLSCGKVVIHDNVEIGAATTIDKGVSGDTIIGEGTKIDNKVHIGHGAVIGKNCLFAAQVGIGGKAIIEDDVILWGQVGVSKDLTIGKGAVVLGQSGVGKSIPGNITYMGSPVDEARKKFKEMAMIRNLPKEIEFLKSPA